MRKTLKNKKNPFFDNKSKKEPIFCGKFNIDLVLLVDATYKTLNSELKNFEYALQNFSAAENGDIDVIVT